MIQDEMKDEMKDDINQMLDLSRDKNLMTDDKMIGI
jgi:hypothetical protein